MNARREIIPILTILSGHYSLPIEHARKCLSGRKDLVLRPENIFFNAIEPPPAAFPSRLGWFDVPIS